MFFFPVKTSWEVIRLWWWQWWSLLFVFMSKSFSYLVWLCRLWSCSFSTVPVHTLIWKQAQFSSWETSFCFQGVEENSMTVLCERWHKDGVKKVSKPVAVSAAGVLYLPSFLIIYIWGNRYFESVTHWFKLNTVLTSHCYIRSECADLASTWVEKFPLKHTQTTEINCSSFIKLYRILCHSS